MLNSVAHNTSVSRLATAAENARANAVRAPLNYLAPSAAKASILVPAAAQGDPQRVAEYRTHDTMIHDMRPLSADLSLDLQGFELVTAPSAVRDFHDETEVRRTYYREIEDLVRASTGASKVLTFDHTLRIDSTRQGRKPVRTVHNDYTVRSGPQRVRDLLEPDEASRRLNARFAVINAWRPINNPVLTAPLAIADARSVAPAHFVATDLVYSDRVGEIYDVAHHREHAWYYAPRMLPTEVLLIKTYDRATDGRARFTAHTAFDDPKAPAGAAPRQSIEVRMLVFFDR